MKMFIFLFFVILSFNLTADEIGDLVDYDQGNVVVTVYDKEDYGDYDRSLLILRRQFSDDIPFYLAAPKTQPRGIVLLLHGITSSKDIWWQSEGPYSKLREYRSGLVEAGFIVIAPDARYHGQRIATANFESPMAMLGGQQWLKLRDLIAGSAGDFRSLVDYAKAEFPDLPVGVLGQSLGAMQALVMAATEKRLDFVVPVFPPIQKLSSDLESVYPMNLAPKIDLPALLLISDRDVWYSFEDGKELYNRLASKQKQLLVLPTRHEMDLTKADEVIEWIKDQSPQLVGKRS